eukprot:tig00021127_g18757.t1
MGLGTAIMEDPVPLPWFDSVTRSPVLPPAAAQHEEPLLVFETLSSLIPPSSSAASLSMLGSPSRPFSASAARIRQPVALQKHRLGVGGYPVIRAPARTLELSDPLSPMRTPPAASSARTLMRSPPSAHPISHLAPPSPQPHPSSPHRAASPGGADSEGNTPIHHKDPYVESLISRWEAAMSPLVCSAQKPTLEGLRAALKERSSWGARGVLRSYSAAELAAHEAFPGRKLFGLDEEGGGPAPRGPRPGTSPMGGSPARGLRRMARGAQTQSASSLPRRAPPPPPSPPPAVDAEEAAMAAEMEAARRRKPFRVDPKHPRMTRAAIMREGASRDKLRDFELWRIKTAETRSRKEEEAARAAEFDPMAQQRRRSSALEAEELAKANHVIRKAALDEERLKAMEAMREEIAEFIVRRPKRTDAPHAAMRKKSQEEEEAEEATRQRFGIPSASEVAAITALSADLQRRKLQLLEEELVTKMAETLRSGDEESFLAIYDLIPDVFESKRVYQMKARARRLAGLAALTKTADEVFVDDTSRA